MVPAVHRTGNRKLGGVNRAGRSAPELKFFIAAPRIGGAIRPWPSMNDYIHSMNVNRFKGNDFKKYYTGIAAEYAHEAALQNGWRTPDGKVDIQLDWVEINNRRDPDNVTGGIKFVLDGIVRAGLLNDDSRRYIQRIDHHSITNDKDNPSVWVTLRPVKEG